MYLRMRMRSRISLIIASLILLVCVLLLMDVFKSHWYIHRHQLPNTGEQSILA